MTDKIYDDILELIGHTPVVRLNQVASQVEAEILVKLEFYNPTGSVKDRIALNMIEEARRQGLIEPGDTIVEPTSGNTGTSLALVCALKGYKMLAVMPRQMSQERQDMLRAFGAELVLCQSDESSEPGTFNVDDLELTLATAVKLADKPHHYMPNQFANPANEQAHQKTTAQEIFQQTGGELDAVVAAVGTSGTAVGLAKGLKGLIKELQVFVVEPTASAVISGEAPGFHRIQGIGEGFIPDLFERELFDGVLKVSDQQAKAMACRLARLEGILGGYSAGANVAASLELARRMKPGSRILTLIPDSGMKYLSTELYHHHSEVCRVFCCVLDPDEAGKPCADSPAGCCAQESCP